MKKLTSLLLTILFLVATPVYAVTSTPSATPSLELQDKIKTLVKENLETTENLIQKEVTSKSLLGYTGKVKSIGSKNLTLEIEKDILQISILTTTSITKDGAEIKTSSIALGDKLMIIGTKTKDDVIEAKIINVIKEDDPTTIVVTKPAIATIKNLDLKKKTFTLTINGEDVAYTLSKKTTVKLDDFKEGDTILAITKKYQGKYSLSRAVKI